MEKLILNKNRGWRGLAEAQLIDDAGNTTHKMVFSFSQPVWNDMLRGVLVIQDDDNYIILKFDKLEKLPAPTQQRSVLLKNVILPITSTEIYPKATWLKDHKTAGDYSAICNFLKNRNNHTTSDWNCIRNTCNSIYYIIYKMKGVSHGNMERYKRLRR